MLDDTDMPGRQDFLAFAGDETSRAALTAFAEARGWSPERVVAGGIEEAAAGLAGMATPELLVIDVGAAPDPLAAIESLAEVCDPGTRVVVLGEVNDVALYRRLLESGIGDYLVKPVSAEALAEAVARIEARQAAARRDTGGAALSGDPGKVICVIGARGGAGATTVAVNLAWLMAHEFRQRTALVDLDLHFGTAALALDLEPGRGLGEALQAPDRIDDLFLERAAVKESANLAVLAAEEPVTRRMGGMGPALAVLFERLQGGFERTVVEVPRAMIGSTPEIAGIADTFVLVTDLSLAGLRDSIAIAKALEEAAPRARLVTVVSREGALKKAEVARGDFEKSYGHSIDHVIPFDPKGAAAAALKGRTFAQAARKLPAARMLERLARDVAEPAEVVQGGWFKRKSAKSAKPLKPAKKKAA